MMVFFHRRGAESAEMNIFPLAAERTAKGKTSAAYAAETTKANPQFYGWWFTITTEKKRTQRMIFFIFH